MRERERNENGRRAGQSRLQKAVALLLVAAAMLSLGGFAFAAEPSAVSLSPEETVSPEITAEMTPAETPDTTPEVTSEVTPEVTPEPSPTVTPDPEETDSTFGLMTLELEPEGRAAGQIPVQYYVAVNGAWKLLASDKSEGTENFNGNNRYYVTASKLATIYADYGFKTSDITGGTDRIFPHTESNNPNTVYADAAPIQKDSGGVSQWLIPLVNVSKNNASLYYLPNNKSGHEGYFNDSNSTANALTNNTFYTVEVNANGLTEATVPATQIVFNGNSATVTLPKLDEGKRWRVTDGERTITPPPSAEGENKTTVYTINNISSRYVFTASSGITVEYDATAAGQLVEESHKLKQDGLINGNSTYSVDIPTGEAHSVLRIDYDTVTVTKGAAGATREIYYTFKGWKLGDVIYNYPDTIPAETLKTAAEANNGTVKLQAVWSPYIQGTDGKNYIATIGFYIQKGIEVHGTDYDYTLTAVSEFTEATFFSRVKGAPENAETNLSPNNYTLIKEPTDASSATKVDKTIRESIIKPFYGIELVDGMPSDVDVFNYLQKSGKKNDVLYLGDEKLNLDKLTPDRFTIRWYVVKYDSTDGFHVDGVIVAKPATLVVKKTFAGDSATINEVKKNFYITLEHDVTEYNPNGNTSTGEHKVDFKLVLESNDKYSNHPKDGETGATLVGYDSHDPESDTYTWIVTGYQGVDYQVIENNHEKPKDKQFENIVQETTYRITNMRVQNEGDPSDTGWKMYMPTTSEGHRTGVPVRIVAYADDFPMESRQTVTLHNSYSKPGVITIFKRDEAHEGGIPNVGFTLADQSGQALRLYRNGTSAYYSTQQSEEYATAVNAAVTDEHGHFFIELHSGTYSLAETTPKGYYGAKKVTFTVKDDNTIDPDSVTAVPPDGFAGEQVWAEVKTAAESDKPDGEETPDAPETTSATKNKQLDVINRARKFDITVKNTWRAAASSESGEVEMHSVQIDLYRNKVKIGTAELNGENEWKYTWPSMPMFVDGKLAEYSVTVAKIGDIPRSTDLVGAKDGYANYNVTEDAFKYWSGELSTDTEIHPEPYWEDKAEKDKVLFAEHLLIGVNIQPVNGELSFKKHADTLSGPGLKGAKYALYNDAELQSVHTAEKVSDVHGLVNFGALSAGDYYLVETEAPAGFIKDETVYKVSVLKGEAKITKYKDKAENGTLFTGEDAKRQVFDMVNETKLNITLNYKNTACEPLTDGIVELYSTDADGANASLLGEAHKIDTDDGVTLTLGQGTYRLKQTKAKDGYLQYEDEYDFRVDNGVAYPVIQLRMFALMRSAYHAPGFDIAGDAQTGFVITLYNEKKTTPPVDTDNPNPDNTDDKPNPDKPTSPTPSPTPGTIWWQSPYGSGGLPQTGQLNWPVPVLATLGAALIAAGLILSRSARKKDKR